jgi:hypothetical protein
MSPRWKHFPQRKLAKGGPKEWKWTMTHGNKENKENKEKRKFVAIKL